MGIVGEISQIDGIGVDKRILAGPPDYARVEGTFKKFREKGDYGKFYMSPSITFI